MKFLSYLSTIIISISLLITPGVLAHAQETELTFTDLDIEILKDAEVRIEWSTTAPAFYMFEYGLTTDYGSQIRGTDARQRQEVYLRNLEPKEKYHFRVIAYTSDDRRTVMFDQTFKTKKKLDTDKPELEEFRMPLITDTAVYFQAQTDEKATIILTYWKQGQENKKRTKRVQTKENFWANGTIKGLRPNATYEYDLKFIDKDDNAINFQTRSFTMQSSSFELADFAITNIRPIDTNSPLIGDTSATIDFKTTLPARCSVSHTKQSGGGSSKLTEPNYKTWQHTFTIDNLKPGTAYKYNITCTDFRDKTITIANTRYTTKKPVVLGYSNEPTKPFGGKDFELIKTADSPKIYVAFVNQMYHIKNPDILKMYGLENEPIKVVSNKEFSKYSTVRLVQNSAGDLYYLYLDKNKKKKINSNKVNNSYSYNKNRTAIELSEFDLNTYQDMTLVKTADDPTVYYITNGYKRPIASWDVFVSRGWKPWEIGIVNKTDLASYTTASPIQ